MTRIVIYDLSTDRFDDVLYGYLTSKDMPGIVPNCILFTFEGFALSEVYDEEVDI